MNNEQEYPKETETQATLSPIPVDADSPIAPQGYEPELIEEIADMETPQQKRRKAVRYLIWIGLLLVGAIYMCRPAETDLPADIPIPYGLEARPVPAPDRFLPQIAPKTLGDFTLVHQQVERSFEEPFVGAEIATATYTNSRGEAATLDIINAESYINANRYLRGLEAVLTEEVSANEVTSRIWLKHSFLEWTAPELGNRSYGFAWSNEHFYFSVTSAIAEHRDFFAENFPY